MPATHDVAVTVRADRPTGPCRPFWTWFGHDEPNYATTPHGRKLLAELAALGPQAAPGPEPARIRTHNLLTSGDGKPALKWGSTGVYREDAAGNPVYDWTILDRIFDTWVKAGVIPFVQVGFTPEPLSDAPGPYRHSWSLTDPTATITTGWAAPPNDLGKWEALVHAWARHLADRYGEARVATWPWELWNEPDGHYWTGTVEEFCALYDVTARALKAALPAARIGGPHTCGPSANPKAAAFLRAFLRHVTDSGTPLDFVAFHAKGKPVLHQGRVRMGLGRQLADIAAGLAIVAEFPALRHLPVIIGESDPEGCAACSARVHPQNAYRNGPLYGAYVIESMLRTHELAARAGVTIEGAVTWAFLFDGQPFFDGFRTLATNGIGKAVLNAFRLLGHLRGDWLAAESSHALPLDTILADGVRAAPDITAAATRDEAGISILLCHYHDDDVAESADPDIAEVTLAVTGLPAADLRLRHFRVDHSHGNAFAEWQRMGAPQAPDPQAYARLEAAARLPVIEDRTLASDAGRLTLRTRLPRQGASVFRLGW